MKTLQRLKINNFLNTSEREIFFDDKWDVILITGENAKGKTTIMRAIYLCLTGEDAFFGANKLDNVIKNGQDELNIELELSRGDNQYKIEVNKKLSKPLKIKIFENGERLNTSELLSDAKVVLSNLFGTQKNILNNYFFFSASDDDIVTATPSWRLDIITKSSNIFQEYEEISKQASVFEKELSDLETAKKSLLIDTENRIQENIDEYSLLMDNLTEKTNISLFNEEVINNYIDKLNENLSDNTEQYNKILRIESLQREVNSVKDVNIEEISKKINESEENEEFNKSIDKKVSNIKNLLQENEDIKSTETNKYHIIEKSILSIEWDIKSEKIQLKEVNNDFVDEKNFDKNKKDFENLSKEKSNIENRWKAIETEVNIKVKDKEDIIKTFEHNKICPVCHSKLTNKALKIYLDTIEKDLIVLEEERTELRNKWTTVSKSINSLNEFINNTQIFINNKTHQEKIVVLEEQLKQKEDEKESLKKVILTINEKSVKLKEEIINEEKNKKQILSYSEKEQLKKILSSYSNIQSKLDEISSIEKELKNIDKKDILEKVNNVKNNIQEITLLKEKIKSNITQMDKEKEKEKNIKNELDIIKKDREQYANLVEFFWKNGIQKKQVEHVLQNVELETNSIINKFFNNIAIKFWFDGKGISLDIVRQTIDSNGVINNVEDDIKNFSDAQQEILRVIIKLSFSRSIQYLQWVPLNMIFFNETFGKLSEDKEIELKKILDFFGQENQVVFITHNKNITSYFEESSIIKIV